MCPTKGKGVYGPSETQRNRSEKQEEAKQVLCTTLVYSTVLASQRLETSIRSYAVVLDSANPSRRALYSIVEQAGNPVNMRESPRFTIL